MLDFIRILYTHNDGFKIMKRYLTVKEAKKIDQLWKMAISNISHTPEIFNEMNNAKDTLPDQFWVWTKDKKQPLPQIEVTDEILAVIKYGTYCMGVPINTLIMGLSIILLLSPLTLYVTK